MAHGAPWRMAHGAPHSYFWKHDSRMLMFMSYTAGNSSQVSDGAGAVLLMKRSVAMQKGLPILGVFRSFAAVGVDPAIIGVGPAVVIPAAVKSAGPELGDRDLFEINEAFASQFVYCRKKLELDPEKINVNGGAMAIGHPLGAIGTTSYAYAILNVNPYYQHLL
ncbi:UNVERIFIED_CONTAM: 3-ketoacyl-CoA thiolase 2, peroxisomal [Sesamum latifolium]|uniref:3-ketoacyl-CoA thiolase 2, peroxisomal n=1 Tax=Sesamum latifolium TaxID=2727402 RepID=A0AAW2SR48_9LAMI